MGWRSQIAQELTKWTHIVAEDFARFESALEGGGFFGVRVILLKEQVYFKFISRSSGANRIRKRVIRLGTPYLL